MNKKIIFFQWLVLIIYLCILLLRFKLGYDGLILTEYIVVTVTILLKCVRWENEEDMSKEEKEQFKTIGQYIKQFFKK